MLGVSAEGERDSPALIDPVHDQVQVPAVLIWDIHSQHTAGGSRRSRAQGMAGVVHPPKYAHEPDPVGTRRSPVKTFLANRAHRSVDGLRR